MLRVCLVRGSELSIETVAKESVPYGECTHDCVGDIIVWRRIIVCET